MFITLAIRLPLVNLCLTKSARKRFWLQAQPAGKVERPSLISEKTGTRSGLLPEIPISPKLATSSAPAWRLFGAT